MCGIEEFVECELGIPDGELGGGVGSGTRTMDPGFVPPFSSVFDALEEFEFCTGGSVNQRALDWLLSCRIIIGNGDDSHLGVEGIRRIERRRMKTDLDLHTRLVFLREERYRSTPLRDVVFLYQRRLGRYLWYVNNLI